MRQTPTVLLALVAATLVTAHASGCVNRPGWPEQDGAKRLRRQGFDAVTIDKVVQGRPLEEAVYKKLENSKNQDIGFLLARNPNLSVERMTRLSGRKNDFVRAGLARNPALPPDLVQTLLDDSSHTVWIGLAANPSLSTEVLLKLKRRHGIDWSWFAMNPALPPEIDAAIRKSRDDKALYWLKRTQANLRGWPIEKPHGK